MLSYMVFTWNRPGFFVPSYEHCSLYNTENATGFVAAVSDGFICICVISYFFLLLLHSDSHKYPTSMVFV
jgi:hypothetical protein